MAIIAATRRRPPLAEDLKANYVTKLSCADQHSDLAARCREERQSRGLLYGRIDTLRNELGDQIKTLRGEFNLQMDSMGKDIKAIERSLGRLEGQKQ